MGRGGVISGVAPGESRWGRVLLLAAKTLPKIREKRGKSGKSEKKEENREEKAKSGRYFFFFFYFAPLDR